MTRALMRRVGPSQKANPMTDHAFTMPNLADLTEAARLTQSGKLQEATALLQRGLSGQAPASRASQSRPPTIDLVADETGTFTAQATRPEPMEADSHAAVLPRRLREGLGQVLKGLKGIAPVTKGLSGFGLPGMQPESRVPSDPRFVERSFSNAAGARDYKLFIPTGQTGPRPLVVMLHGCTQSPDDFAAGTRMNELAERDGFYVAYPRQTSGGNAQKCWNWFQPADQGRERGESGIIAGIVRTILGDHPIDPARVYIAGLSAGGAQAVNVARAYPDLFAGVGVHSGLAAGSARDLSSALMAMRAGAPGSELPGGGSGFGTGQASDAVRVPTIVFHGANDATVSPKNGDAVLAQAGIAGLSPRRESGTQAGGHRYSRTRYADGQGRVQVESWHIDGAGHAWSGGSQAGSYTDPLGPDASRAMLDFFAEHRLGALRG
jgi:poly(hydroxyalkanoate) depolymerase family esterase